MPKPPNYDRYPPPRGYLLPPGLYISHSNVGDSNDSKPDDQVGVHAGADNSGPGAQLLHRVVLLALLPVRLQGQLLLPPHTDDRNSPDLHHGADPALADLPPALWTAHATHPVVQVDLHRHHHLPRTDSPLARVPPERDGEPRGAVQRRLDLELLVLRGALLPALPLLPRLLRLPPQFQPQGHGPHLLPGRTLAQVMDPQRDGRAWRGWGVAFCDRAAASIAAALTINARDRFVVSIAYFLHKICNVYDELQPSFCEGRGRVYQRRKEGKERRGMLWVGGIVPCFYFPLFISDQLSSSSMGCAPYLSALLAFSICLLRFSIALRLILVRYSSKLISFSSPSTVFSSPSKITSISCSNLRMISFSSVLPLRSRCSLARTNSSSRVSSTVMRQLPGRQYIRNCVRWNRFLLSAAAGSMVHFLYMVRNSFSLILRFKSSSNSHSMRSISALLILEPMRRSTSRSSPSPKCFPPPLRLWNTRSRYFSSVGFIFNYYSFYSIVFYFCALRSRSLRRSNSKRREGEGASFSKMGEFLYLRCRCGGSSRYFRRGFDYSFIFYRRIIQGCGLFSPQQMQIPPQTQNQQISGGKLNHRGKERYFLLPFQDYTPDPLPAISYPSPLLPQPPSQRAKPPQFLVNYPPHQFYLQSFRIMSDRPNRTADELESLLNQTLAQMHEHQKNANYVEAENSRLTGEQLKKDLEARRVYEMEVRHAQEQGDLDRSRQEELNSFNSFWDKKISEYNAEGERLVSQMSARHLSDENALKSDLQKQLPYKVKESSEYLNLKKMEEHMARQKIYTEAHKVQLRLQDLEKSEKEAWINARNLKIETAVNTLHARQAAEMAALQKKIRTGLDEQNKDRLKEENRIAQKYANIDKELKANHDKEIMAFRGQFRSKGGQGSPLLLTKSKLLSSR